MINVVVNLKKDFLVRWRLLGNSEVECERRIFAGLELFCFPASFLTLFVLLPLRIAAAQTGMAIPVIGNHIMNILLSAAVGYITNYIAIEMLFKPYRKNRWHPLSIVTFGYWQQGLVPKNKNRIGAEMGRQIETKLLNPERMADELCEMVMGFIQDKKVIGNLRDAIQNLLRTHEQGIVDFLIPQIETSLTASIDRIVTPERIGDFWEKEIAPQLSSEDNRKIIASHIVEGIQRRSPQLVEMLKVELRKISFDYLSPKIPFGFGADALADGLVEFIQWGEIERRLRYKLGEESTEAMIREELLGLVDKVNCWLRSPESSEKVESLTREIKKKLIDFLHHYLHETLPAMTTKTIESEDLWNWVGNGLLPSAKPKLETLIKEQGKDKIVAKLNLSARVTEAVEKQDVKDFHDMINSIAAQHLGAIQVLGYFLGAIVGISQIFL